MIDKTAFDIIGEYYAKPRPGAEYVPGRICDTGVYHLPAGSLNVLKFDIEGANRGDPVTYTIGSVDEQTFKHNPAVRPRPLEWDEAFAVLLASRRRVVVLSPMVAHPGVAGLPKQPFPEVNLVCPLYRFHDTQPHEFRLRLEAWEYPMFFHLPSSDAFDMIEGFLRFDRCLAIPKPQLRLTGTALSDNALLAMQHCFSWFLTGKLEGMFAEYRQLLLKALGRALRPGAS